LIGVRGTCWRDTELGDASVHQQWGPPLDRIFEIANNFNLAENERREQMRGFLRED
jgi:hypothetical protein